MHVFVGQQIILPSMLIGFAYVATMAWFALGTATTTKLLFQIFGVGCLNIFLPFSSGKGHVVCVTLMKNISLFKTSFHVHFWPTSSPNK